MHEGQVRVSGAGQDWVGRGGAGRVRQRGNSFHLRFHLTLETSIPPSHPLHTWVDVIESQQPVLPRVARVRRQLQALAVRLYRLAYSPNVPLQYAQVVVRLRVGGARLDGGCEQRQRLLCMTLRCIDDAKVVQALWKGGRREGESEGGGQVKGGSISCACPRDV